MTPVQVIPMRDEHAAAVLRIYSAGIRTGDATFETTVPTWETFDRTHLPSHRFVAIDAGGDVVGWVAAVSVSSRCVYAGVIEHSVYVDPAAHGRGTGGLLLDALITASEHDGVWTIQSGIFPENTASLALHRRAGFRIVGIRERIGQRDGRWRDVVMIERRSATVGTAPSRRPRVLFVCVKNAGKSQMAAGLMRAVADERVEIHSAGTTPGTALNPESAACLFEVGVDISDEHPKPVDPELLARMDCVITLGREATIDTPPDGVVVEDWDIDEPSRHGIDGMDRMRLIRDDISCRVDDLVRRLDQQATQPDRT